MPDLRLRNRRGLGAGLFMGTPDPPSTALNLKKPHSDSADLSLEVGAVATKDEIQDGIQVEIRTSPVNLVLKKPKSDSADLNLEGAVTGGGDENPVQEGINLVLKKPKSGSADLSLEGAEGSSRVTVVFDIPLELIVGINSRTAVNAFFDLSQAAYVYLNVSPPSEVAAELNVFPSFETDIVYLVDVWRGIGSHIDSHYVEGLNTSSSIYAPHGATTKTSKQFNGGDLTSCPQSTSDNISWRVPSPASGYVEIAHGHTTSAEGTRRASWAHGEALTNHMRGVWWVGVSVATERQGEHFEPISLRLNSELIHAAAPNVQLSVEGLFNLIIDLQRVGRVILWGRLSPVVSLYPRQEAFEPPPATAIPRIVTADLRLACQLSDNADLHFLGCAGKTAVKSVPIKEVYFMKNMLWIKRVSDNAAIPAKSVKVGFNFDSWAWSFSAELLGAGALAAIEPVNDTPTELLVHINGYEWVVLAEEWGETRAFGERSVSVKGRGLTAYLSSDYETPASGSNGTSTTFAQMLAEFLPPSGGWSIAYPSTNLDWGLLPNVFSWEEESTIAKMHRAVQQVGMVLIPDRSQKLITIRPRDVVPPWRYDSTAPSFTIPDQAIESRTRGFKGNREVNGVIVHGNERGGILAQCTRYGTAGSVLAPTQSSPLITDTNAARVLATRILSKNATPPRVKSFSTILSGDIPLIEAGTFLKVATTDGDILATSNGVSVVASVTDTSTKVRQTVTLGEESSNSYAKFSRLLKQPRVLLGSVTTRNTDNTVIVELVGGGFVRVLGDATEGSNVYIKDGAVLALAPNLPIYDIEI